MEVIEFIIGAVALWKTAQYISGFIEEKWLLEHQRRGLREKFEDWWISVAKTKPRYFAVALARGASEGLTDFFGKRFFSKRAFIRSSVISTGLLIMCLSLTGILGIGVYPWKEFETSVKGLKNLPEVATTNGASSDAVRIEAESRTKLKLLGERLDRPQWKIVYCTGFYIILIAANAMSFFLSVAYSRLVLQEIVASGRVFAACALIALNLFLVISTASLFLLFATILAYPGLWVFVLLAFLLSTESFYWLLAMLFGGGIAVWAFGNTSLQIVSMLSILPCLGTVLICVVSLCAMLDRKRFHMIVCSVLLRCTDKKPLSFIVGFLCGGAVLIAVFCKTLRFF